MDAKTSAAAKRKTPASSGVWRILSDNRGTVTALWGLGLAGVGLSVVLPDQVGALTERFSGRQAVTWSPVLVAVGYLVLAQIGLSVVSYFRTRMEASLHGAMTQHLALGLFARILRFGADFFRDQEVERINARALEDGDRAVRFRIGALIEVPLACASIAVFGGIMIFDNWLLGTCMVLSSLLSGYFVLFDRQIQAINREARGSWEGVRVSANEIVGGVSEFRNHFAFDHALDGLRRPFEAFHRVMVRAGRLNALFGMIDPLIVTVQKGVLFALGAGLCIGAASISGFAGTMTWAGVIKFMLLAQLFQQPVGQIASQALQWRMARESIRRVEEYLERPCVFERPDPAPEPPAGRLDVGYQRVSVVVPSGASLIKDVDLDVRPSEHVALCGPSGCGKSTLLQMLVRATEPSSGRLVVAGREIDQHDPLALAREIGFVSQVPPVFNMTLRDNLLLGLRRPSAAQVRDARGPLDVERLGTAVTADEVDRVLIRVVRRVGLERDVILKCLDHPLPDVPAAARFRDRVGALRDQVAHALSAPGGPWVIPFHRHRYIPGTVGDNLLGPGYGCDNGAATAVWAALGACPLRQDLLRLGYRRLCSERSMAVRVGQQRPGLLDLLEERGRMTEAEGPRSCGPVAHLEGLPQSYQETLIEIALETDADLARELAASGEFESRIIEARGARFMRAAPAAGPWDMAGSPAWIERLSVRENLLCGRTNTRLHGAAERVDEMIQKTLEASGLADDALLLGLEFRAGEGGKLLSGGQRQKVVIGRIVMKNPSVLLLDEATASLDEASQAGVLDMVRQDFRDRTVVSISHRLSTVRDFDRVVVLDRGRVVQQGTYDDLEAQPGIFCDLVRRERGEPVEPSPSQAPRKGEGAEEVAPTPERQELRRRIAMTTLFSRLHSDQLAFVESAMKVVQCPKGEVLFRRGDPGQDLYVILDGTVDFFVEQKTDGKSESRIVNSAGPGGIFGELAMFGSGLRTVGARARADATLGRLGREDLERLIQADPGIAVELLGVVSSHLARTCDAAYEAPPQQN